MNAHRAHAPQWHFQPGTYVSLRPGLRRIHEVSAQEGLSRDATSARIKSAVRRYERARCEARYHTGGEKLFSTRRTSPHAPA
jgi:hypothetical protein